MDIFGNDTLAYIDFADRTGAVYNGSMWVVLLDCPIVYTVMAMWMSYWIDYLNFELPFNFTDEYPFNTSTNVSGTDIFNMSFVFQQVGNYSDTNRYNIGINRLVGTVCTIHVPEDARVPLFLISSFCALVMLISHVIIALLGYLDKEILSPIFITLQSFSIVSIVDGLYCWYGVSSPCVGLVRDTDISCIVWLGIEKYLESSICYHLLLLSSLRIYMTLYPLQCQANVTKTRTRYILCGMYLLNLIATPLYVSLLYTYDGTCTFHNIVEGPLFNSETQSAEFPLFVLAVIVIVVFIIGMVVSFVKSRLSTARLQSSSQRQQSRLASIFIILFLVIYWPTAILRLFVTATCNNSIAMNYSKIVTKAIKLLFHTINPFILCLRLKSVRQKLKAASCQKCTDQ